MCGVHAHFWSRAPCQQVLKCVWEGKGVESMWMVYLYVCESVCVLYELL